MGKVEVIKSEKADKPNYIWAIVIVILVVVYAFRFLSIFDDSSTDNSKSCDTFQCSRAEQYALEDIPELARVWETVKSNELKCNANSITTDDIILVKCTTTHSEIIDYYGSSTIWYGWLSSADGSRYFRYADTNKDTVLTKLRD